MAAARRTPAGDPRAGFRRAAEPGPAVPQGLLRAARKSGQLNLSGRSLGEGEPGGKPGPRGARSVPAGTRVCCPAGSGGAAAGESLGESLWRALGSSGNRAGEEAGGAPPAPWVPAWPCHRGGRENTGRDAAMGTSCWLLSFILGGCWQISISLLLSALEKCL